MAGKPRESSQPLTLKGDVEEWAEENTPKTGRQRVVAMLDHIVVQLSIVITVFIQLLLLTALLLIDLRIIQTPSDSPESSVNESGGRDDESNEILPVDRAELAMHIINIFILSVFIIEMFVRAAVLGKSILKDRWQMYDMAVVVVTFSLYVGLAAASARRTVTYSVGFIIVLRLWRIGRIYHGITQPIKRKAERVINSHRKARKLAENELQAKIAKQKKEIAQLRRQLAAKRPSNFNPDTDIELSSEVDLSIGVEKFQSLPEGFHGETSQYRNGTPAMSGSPTSTISQHDSIETVIEVTGVNLDLRKKQTEAKDAAGKHGELCPTYSDVMADFGQDILDRDIDSDNDTIRASSRQSSTSGGSTIKAPDYLTEEGSEMDFSEEVIRELTSKEFEKEMEGRPPLDEKDSGKGDSFRNEKQDLIPNARLKDTHAYFNAGFSENESCIVNTVLSENDLHNMTQEEISEIERIAQVPFMYGSTSRIHQDGIPMTDL